MHALGFERLEKLSQVGLVHRVGPSYRGEHEDLSRPDDRKTVLLTMPDVGDDADFARIRDLPRRVDL